VQRATRHAFPQGWATAKPGSVSGPDDQLLLLEAAGFVDIAQRTFVQHRAWSIDEIAGYLQSTSVCSRRILGERVDAFLAELKTDLLAHDPGGSYPEEIDFGCIIARKPA